MTTKLEDMSRINQMTPAIVKEIRKQMEEALQKVENNCGVKISMGKITYSDLNFTAKIEAAIINADGKAEVKERVDFVNLGWQYGLKKEDLDTQILIQNRRYRIVGLLTRNHRYPIVVESIDTGKRSKVNEDIVRTSLDRLRPIAETV